MKTRLLVIIAFVIAFGFVETAFATHDPSNHHPTPQPEVLFPTGEELLSIDLFQEIHEQVKVKITYLKIYPPLLEFEYTAFNGTSIERLVVTQKVKDNTNHSIRLYNGTINNPVLISNNISDILYYLLPEPDVYVMDIIVECGCEGGIGVKCDEKCPAELAAELIQVTIFTIIVFVVGIIIVLVIFWRKRKCQN